MKERGKNETDRKRESAFCKRNDTSRERPRAGKTKTGRASDPSGSHLPAYSYRGKNTSGQAHDRFYRTIGRDVT